MKQFLVGGRTKHPLNGLSRYLGLPPLSRAHISLSILDKKAQIFWTASGNELPVCVFCQTHLAVKLNSNVCPQIFDDRQNHPTFELNYSL